MRLPMLSLFAGIIFLASGCTATKAPATKPQSAASACKTHYIHRARRESSAKSGC